MSAVDMSIEDYLAMCGIQWYQINPLDDNRYLIETNDMSQEYAERKLKDAGYKVHAVYANTPLEVLFMVISLND